MTAAKDGVRPDRAIRRFDVFAEYTRQDRLAHGDAADEAKGYGIWLAKVVASRRYGSKTDPGDRKGGGHAAAPHTKFRSVGDEPQTDEVFDHDIVERMGARFYREVFAPAITEARDRGEAYEDIRDAIRKGWKPAKSSA
jgi:hypothetical protein